MAVIQGASEYTKYKEGIVSIVCGFIFKNLPEPKRFVSIDMNCGTGRNGNTRGTPVLVANAAKRHGVMLDAYFIDKSPIAINKLMRQPEFAQGDLFESPVRSHFMRKRNEVALPEIARGLNGDKNGAVICDPNGCSGRDIPVDIVADFLRPRPGFHFLLHLSGVERTAGAAKNPEKRADYDRCGTVYSLDRLREAIPIPLQLVHRYADGKGIPHFIGVFSRKWMPPHTEAKLHRVESHQGIHILGKYESAQARLTLS